MVKKNDRLTQADLDERVSLWRRKFPTAAMALSLAGERAVRKGLAVGDRNLPLVDGFLISLDDNLTVLGRSPLEAMADVEGAEGQALADRIISDWGRVRASDMFVVAGPVRKLLRKRSKGVGDWTASEAEKVLGRVAELFYQVPGECVAPEWRFLYEVQKRFFDKEFAPTGVLSAWERAVLIEWERLTGGNDKVPDFDGIRLP